MKLLNGKTAVITGGSDGIGFAIADLFAEHGANIVLIGRDKEKLIKRKKYLSKHKTTTLSISEDISKNDSLSRIYDQIKSLNIKIDILVNNAGIARFIPFKDTKDSDLDYHLNLNVKSPYLLTQTFIEDLICNKGNVINISSYFAKRMLQDRPSTAYSMTKGAIESFTKALAFELGPNGVRVNAIAPGTVTTPQVEKNIEILHKDAQNRFKSMIQSIYPLQKIGEPEDIAEMALFLASNKAKWITGGIFPVDGGLTTN